MDQLVKSGQAIDLGGSGYPSLYTLQANEVLAVLADGPPEANDTWVSGPKDVLTSKWVGHTAIDAAVAKNCKPEEWLIVEVWDES